MAGTEGLEQGGKGENGLFVLFCALPPPPVSMKHDLEALTSAFVGHGGTL